MQSTVQVQATIAQAEGPNMALGPVERGATKRARSERTDPSPVQIESLEQPAAKRPRIKRDASVLAYMRCIPPAAIPEGMWVPRLLEGGFQCTVDGCGATNKTEFGIRVHYRAAHLDDRPFECTYAGCGAAFVRKGDCEAHIRSHLGERPYGCIHPKCGASFLTAGGLTRHTSVHLEAEARPQYPCRVAGCTETFLSSSGRSTHARAHHSKKPKPYACAVADCAYRAYRPSAIVAHAKKHRGGN